MFEAVQVGPFLFRIHLLFLLIGVWLGTELFIRLTLSEGLRLVPLIRKGHWFLLAFLFSGRAFGALLLYRVYVQDPFRLLIFWDGIFSVVGGLVGCSAVLLFFMWRQRSTFLVWSDAFLPVASLVIALDWFGRFFGSLSYGKPTDMPWGVVIESMSVRYTVPIHPVQLYYAFWFFVLTVFLLILRKKSAIGSGIVTLTGVFIGCLGVIFFDFFRGDFAVTVFAKLSDFFFLGLLFISLGAIAVFERKISQRYSLINSILVGVGTMLYLFFRPFINVISVEWRFSQFLAVLAILWAIVYVVVHRWKYPTYFSKS